ncbi:unnamed protein product [Sphagnum compactum]
MAATPEHSEESLHEDLDDLLDSALDDFRQVDGSLSKSSGKSVVQEWDPLCLESGSRVGATTAGQGLGGGLPALLPRKKKSSGSKPPSSSKGIAILKNASPIKTSQSVPEANLSATLDRLAEQTRQTVESITADPEAENPGDDDMMENLVKQFEELSGSQDMKSLVDTMMQQLLSKEVLHEPMKEIGDRYPEWLESHKAQLSGEDFSHYTRQYEYIKQLCHVYETTPNDFQKVVDLMQNMQDCGQPPGDIVRELAPGFELGEDGLPVLPGFSAAGSPGTPANCSIM